jgi:hypothetical protein
MEQKEKKRKETEALEKYEIDLAAYEAQPPEV